MTRRLLTGLILTAALVLLTACNVGGSLDENLATVNAIATAGAGGQVNGGPTPTEGPTQTPTPDPNLYDLTGDPNALLVQTWATIANQASGTPFTLVATQTQMGNFVIEDLRLRFPDVVRGGSVALAPGQVQVNMALVEDDESFGSGTVTFQPTIGDGGTLRLNPQGSNFGGVEVPNGFTEAIGRTMNKALTGNADIVLTQLSFDNQQLRIAGNIQ